MDGWLKLHRSLKDKAIWKCSNPEQKTILITILMMASFRTHEWEWKGGKFINEPGQFITSIDSIVKESGIGISAQNVRTALKKFEKYGFLTNQSTKTGRLITIVNWAFYQAKEDELTNDLTDSSQSTNKDLTTTKEGKKVKKDNKRNLDLDFIRDKFNETCTDLPKIKAITDKRRTTLSRWIEQSCTQEVLEVFEKTNASDFLSGRGNAEWKASFDWIIQPANRIKVLEGNYDNVPKKKANLDDIKPPEAYLPKPNNLDEWK